MEYKNEHIYYNKSLIYNEINNSIEVEKSFTNAIKLNSTNAKVYYNFGLFLSQKNKLKEVEVVLLKGIAINPSAPELYYALTFVYIQTNNKSKAQQTAKILKKLDPNNSDYQQIFQNLGI